MLLLPFTSTKLSKTQKTINQIDLLTRNKQKKSDILVVYQLIKQQLTANITSLMKPAQQKMEENEKIKSKNDRQNIRERQTQVEQLPVRMKREMDGKKTVKIGDEMVMKNLYEKILRESDKFREEQEETLLKEDNSNDIYEYNPHLTYGVISEYHESTEEEKEALGLKDQGFSTQFCINQQIIIVLTGRNTVEYYNGIHLCLYLPRDFFEFIHSHNRGESAAKPPEGLIHVSHRRYAILIQRKIRNNDFNLLAYPVFVVDPDQLLYPTYLCNWIDCKRRITLSNYFLGEKFISQAIVFGSTCHRLLEWLAEKVITIQDLESNKISVYEKLYQSILYDMYLVRSTFQNFIQKCQNSLTNITNFYRNYITLNREIQIDKYKKLYLKIDKVIASQLMFRSMFFGLKGKVDLLLGGKIIDKRLNKTQTVYIPMELKTGKKTSDSHKRQTDMYNILVRETYKQPVIGLLYYSDSDLMIFRPEDPLVTYEIVTIHRNQICLNLINLYKHPSKLLFPNMPKSFPQCGYCQLSTICGILSDPKTKSFSSDNLSQQSQLNSSQSIKLTDIQETPSKYYPEIKQQIQKMQPQQLRYFHRWIKILHIQQLQSKKTSKDHVRMGISSFKMTNQQLGNIKCKSIESKVRLKISHAYKSEKELQIFEDCYKVSQKIRIFIPSICLMEGCKIVQIDKQNKRKIFEMVVEMNNHDIQFNKGRFLYFLEEGEDHNVDLETFETQFFANMRGNICKLLASEEQWIRQLVIYQHIPPPLPIDLDQQQVHEILESQIQGLNQDQQQAFTKAVTSQRLCLIEGMPGTGKTELIIRLIEKFDRQHKKILITTFTNRSLDNILDRLIRSGKIDKQGMIREGTQYSNHNKVSGLTLREQKFSHIKQYEEFLNRKNIWFVTLSSLFIHHLPDKFDVVIVDEASQCVEPVCLEAIMKSQKFILIGDFKQLQPLVKSKQSASLGMNVSLFERLCKTFPQQSVALRKQYRMNESIMHLSNFLVYEGQLQIASEECRSKILSLVNWQEKTSQSFKDVINPQDSIRFINYDPIIDSLNKKHQESQEAIRKVVEIELCCHVYKLFLSFGVESNEIAIISAYNASVHKIVSLLKKFEILAQNHGNVLTIDKSQGIDKQIIILLVQKSNDELIQNPRRLNVALTRAKSKLIVIGSEVHLERMKVWKGSLAKLLHKHKIDLSKQMIEDILKSFQKQGGKGSPDLI